MTSNVTQYSIACVEAPETEPLTLNEVKTFLRLDGDSENAFLTSAISAARMMAEKYMKRSIISQQWKMEFEQILEEEIFLPNGPVTAISEINIVDDEGNITEFPSGKYHLTAGNRSVYFSNIPTGRKVQILFTAGMAEDAASVPVLIKQGMLAHIALMAERNSFVSQPHETAKSLYNFYREVGI